jgi:hypothetical protein
MKQPISFAASDSAELSQNKYQLKSVLGQTEWPCPVYLQLGDCPRVLDLDESFPEDQLLRGIESIEKSIHSAPNDIKSDMNRALITIGDRNSAMRKAVLAAAKRIGEVTIDHGQTPCKTPDVAQAVEKSWAHSEAKFGSPAAHERSMKSMRCRC